LPNNYIVIINYNNLIWIPNNSPNKYIMTHSSILEWISQYVQIPTNNQLIPNTSHKHGMRSSTENIE